VKTDHPGAQTPGGAEPAPTDTDPDAEPEADDRIVRLVEICNKRGLHARASAKFVKLAGTFSASITVTKDDQTVNGTSIMGLLALGAARGCSITIAAKGAEADKAMAALADLVQSKFGEE